LKSIHYGNYFHVVGAFMKDSKFPHHLLGNNIIREKPQEYFRLEQI